MKAAFERLRRASDEDGRWQAFNYALGEAAGETDIHIAGNSISSSIRPMLQSHLDSSPASKYIGQERIQIKTLDEVLPPLCPATDRIWLKIDTQGFEKNVLLALGTRCNELIRFS